MFYFLQKQRLFLLKVLHSNFEEFGGGASSSRLSPEEITRAQSKDEMAQLINNREINPENDAHREFLKNFLQSIGGADGIQDSDIHGGVFSGERMALNRVVQLLKALHEYRRVKSGISGYTKSELDMLNSFYLERGAVKQESTRQRGRLSHDVETDERDDRADREERPASTNPFLADGPLDTPRVKSTTKPLKAKGNELASHNTLEESTHMRGTFSGRTDRTNFIENHGKIKASVSSLLSGKSGSEIDALYQRLDKVASRLQKGAEFTLTPMNNNEMESILKSAGYRFQSTFVSEEITGVYLTLRDMINTQEKIGQAGDAQKIELFFDFNANGVMESNKEMEYLYQSLEALHLRERVDGFDAVAKNLGFGSKENLYALMSDNLFDARAKFQRAYLASIASGFNPTELAKSGRVGEVGRQLLQERQEIERTVDQAIDAFFVQNIDNNGELVNLPSDVKSHFKDEFRSKVGIQGLSMSYINEKVGAGASVNISELTHDFLDSLSLGASEDGIGVSVSKGLFKNFLSKYGTGITVGITSSLRPFLGVTQSIGGHIDEPKELFEMTTKTKVKATAFGTVSDGVMAGGISLSKVNEQTQAGIEQMVDKSQALLQRVTESIIAGDRDFGGSRQEEEAYSQMKQNFEMQTAGMSREEKTQYAPIFEHGYATAYRNELYRQAEGGKLTTISAGVISIAGFLNLPFVMVGGEYISTKHQEVTRDVDRQFDNTYTQISPERVGGHMDHYHGNRVFQFPSTFHSGSLRGGNGEMDVSVGSNTQAQVEASGGYIKIGGAVKTMNIVEYTGGGSVHRTLVIDGGVTDEVGRYLPTGGNDRIHSNFSSPKGGVEVLDTLETTESEKLHSIAGLLTGMIDHDALSDKDTVGITRLQKAIHSYKMSGTPGLQEVWQQYLTVINYEGKGKSFEHYASGRGYSHEQVQQLRNASASLIGAQDKIYVLQALSMAMSSRGAIRPEGRDGYALANGKTVNDYNKEKNRDQYFDKIMKGEFPALSGKIHQARAEWNQAHGNKSKYETVYVDNGLAFSGTDVARKGGSITPLTGSYELIGTGSDAMFDLGELSQAQKRELVARIPNYVLDNYAKTFGAMGVQLNSHQAVKNYLLGGEVKLEAFYSKNAQCINDCIVLNVKTRDGRVILGAGAVASIDAQQNNVMRLGLTYAGKLEEEGKDHDKTKEDKTKEDKTKEDKTKEDKTKEDKTKEDKPKDDEGEDSHSEGEASETEGESSNTEGEATDTEGESSNTEAESSETEGESSNTEGEATDTEGESSNTEGEATDTEGESSNTEGEATDTEGESSNTEAESSETESTPEDSPEDTEVESSETEDTEVESSETEHTEAESSETETTPEDSPEDTDPGTGPSE